jgi:hypothetical protein
MAKTLNPHFQKSSDQLVRATEVSTEFLPQNIYRTYLFIQNQGPGYVTVTFGEAQSGEGEGVRIPAFAQMEFSPALIDSVWLVSQDAYSMVEILEAVSAPEMI